MESPREENEENRRPHREIPRAAPENQATSEDINLVRKLLAEVAERKSTTEKNYPGASKVYRKALCQKMTKNKAKEILSSPNAIDFMSSEESEIDDPDSTSGPKPRKTRKLTWERTKLRNIKSKLDEAHLNGLSSEKQRRTSALVTRTETASVRPCPTNAPSWAVRTD
ncbi:hypothetical protein ACROYT_G037032 [Oculina patagonica]